MALTDDQLAQVMRLRTLANVTETAEPYDDDSLYSLIMENNGSVEGAAASIWRRKAAGYAEMVDVSEGSSTRKLSSLYKQALEMASSLEARNDGSLMPGSRRTTVRPIVRV